MCIYYFTFLTSYDILIKHCEVQNKCMDEWLHKINVHNKIYNVHLENKLW